MNRIRLLKKFRHHIRMLKIWKWHSYTWRKYLHVVFMHSLIISALAIPDTRENVGFTYFLFSTISYFCWWIYEEIDPLPRPTPSEWEKVERSVVPVFGTIHTDNRIIGYVPLLGIIGVTLSGGTACLLLLVIILVTHFEIYVIMRYYRNRLATY